MKQPLLIIGAGNVGGFLSYNIEEFGTYDVLGFLDDDTTKHHQEFYSRKVLGGMEKLPELSAVKNLQVVIGISSPQSRAKVYERLRGFNFSFPNFVSDNVWLSKNVQLGKGVILYPGVSINYETVIHDFVIMNMNCAIGHNCKVEPFSTLAPGVNLAGFTYIEQQVNVGIGVSTRQNVRIGEGAVIGGQSMVIADVPPASVVKGIPARQ